MPVKAGIRSNQMVDAMVPPRQRQVPAGVTTFCEGITDSVLPEKVTGLASLNMHNAFPG
jgi:hypothetical protein